MINHNSSRFSGASGSTTRQPQTVDADTDADTDALHQQHQTLIKLIQLGIINQLDNFIWLHIPLSVIHTSNHTWVLVRYTIHSCNRLIEPIRNHSRYINISPPVPYLQWSWTDKNKIHYALFQNYLLTYYKRYHIILSSVIHLI